jgi:glycosyltransferase involved in cell wall biosynthesis
MMSKIGIGIVTYNRIEYMQRVVDGIRAHTTSEYELVVADDGSTDGTSEWCRENGIRVISGANGGVCWNKNRALFALQELGCDPILLLEDDCVPVRADWDWDWRIATALYGHVAFAHPKLAPWLISGTGTPVDPFVNNKATAQCSSASGLALSQVGFFDTRFKGYGVGHAEWTTRMKRLGYGFRKAIDLEGREVKANLYIEGGLVGDDAPTFKDKANIARNEALFTELKKEAPFRSPWYNDEERLRFLAEQKKAGIGSARYEALNGSEEDRDARLNSRYLKPYGRAFRRVIGEPTGFMRRTSWLSSVALQLPLYGDEIVPSFVYPMIDLLAGRVHPTHTVLVIGGGIGAVWWASRVSKVGIIDINEESFYRLIDIWPVEKASLEVCDDGLASLPNMHYDVVVVNELKASDKIREYLEKLKSDGVLILSSSAHLDIKKIDPMLTRDGFRQLTLYGPAPMAVEVASSTVLYRSDNCFGI